jgi:hypothetical protein
MTRQSLARQPGAPFPTEVVMAQKILPGSWSPTW